MKFDYRLALAEELRLRQARNPRYSLRSFARDLGVSVTALSDVMAAKRHFSARNASRIVEKLGWSPLEQLAFLETLSSPATTQNRETLVLEDDHFRVISEWYYVVILNLAKLPEAKSTPSWICERTGISVTEAKEALSRLKRLGYISTTGGRLKREIPTLETPAEIPSAAIRKYHRQNFHVAERAQEHVPFARRQISSITVATDAARVQKAKKMLSKFTDDLIAALESDKPTEVYTVSTQMFPAHLFGEDEK